MPSIQRLPQHVVNKIAAGEVIERPASVVKELLENALDAGATRIAVTAENGGMELIRVADNGCGIPPHELPLAVECHATSKIRTADDLFNVTTLGFRGEALASIAAVSRFSIKSRAAGYEAGAAIALSGGAWPEDVPRAVPCACPEGTTVDVRNLFFNTPVRRKFLKSAPTEMGHLSEAFTRLALAHPNVHFSLRHNQRDVHELPPVGEVRQRISAFFGRELADGLVAVATTAQGVVLRGYVAPPSHNRPHQRMQYLFLNGRYIRDRALGHALSEAYRGLLLGGRYPICFLWFDVPPSTVDVNVHPTKLEVRFLDSGRLYSLLLGTLRERFLATDLTTRLQAPAAAAPLADPWTDDEPAAALDPRREQQVREDFVAWAKGQIGSMPPPAASSQQSVAPGITSAGTPLPPPAIELPGVSASGPTDESSGLLLRLNRLSRPAIAPPPPFPPDDDRDEPPWESPASPAQPGSPATSASMAISTSTRDPALPGALPPRLPSRGMQVHDRYLIAESDEGLLVIDQHALHERILYEQLRQRVLAGNVESQRLLVPEAVDLSPAEAATVLDQAPLLEKLGIRVEPFGGDTVLISAYPAMLANVALGDVLRSIIDRLLQAGRAPSARDLFDDLLHMIACKAAVKAGDRLNPEEISALLEQRHLVADTHHCPHGRPTALVLTRAELDRQFLRT